MANHINSDTELLRYIYILEVDNRGNKSKFYGQKKILYTGITTNLKKRFMEHLRGINSKFLATNFRDARKKIVFVDYIYGTEYDAMGVELEIKRMDSPKKKDLIKSPQNKLINYFPLKAIILKKYNRENERIAIRL